MILVGKDAMVVVTTNKDLAALKGTIIEDTEKTLVLRTAQGEKTIIKGTATLRLADGTIVNTAPLNGTHAERAKK